MIEELHLPVPANTDLTDPYALMLWLDELCLQKNFVKEFRAASAQVPLPSEDAYQEFISHGLATKIGIVAKRLSARGYPYTRMCRLLVQVCIIRGWQPKNELLPAATTDILMWFLASWRDAELPALKMMAAYLASARWSIKNPEAKAPRDPDALWRTGNGDIERLDVVDDEGFAWRLGYCDDSGMAVLMSTPESVAR